MRRALLALLGVVLVRAYSTSTVTAAKSPVVNVSLRSGWDSPPFLVELLETFSLEYPDSFFPLLDLVSSSPALGRGSAQDIHKAILKLALDNGLLMDKSDVAAVDSTLALHAATPVVEAFYSYYRDRHGVEGRRCPGEGGETWVDWYGRVVCNVKDLKKLVLVKSDPDDADANASSSYARPQVLTFDHIYPPRSRILSPPPRTAILYASLESPRFSELHQYLYALSREDEPGVEYILRYVAPASVQEPGKAKSPLTGYGVALDLKKTDYLVVDDRHSHASGKSEDGKKEQKGMEKDSDPLLDFIHSFRQEAKGKEQTDPNAALTQNEILELGYKASQLLISTTNHTSYSPLHALTLLSQNFPKYVHSLSRRITVSSAIESELASNAVRAQPGANVVWVNGGMVIKPGSEVAPQGSGTGGGGGGSGVDVLAMKRVMRRERRWVRALEDVGMSREEAVKVISDSGGVLVLEDPEDIDHDKEQEDGPKGKKGKKSRKPPGLSDQVLDGRVDASDRAEGGDVVIWWNDMEKDERYARWNPSFYGLMRPMYPGQFPAIRRNLFNIVLVLDLSRPSSLQFLAGTMRNIIERGLPFRFGLVPAVDGSEESKQMARLVYWLSGKLGEERTIEWIKKVSGLNESPIGFETNQENGDNMLDWDMIKEGFEALVDEVRDELEDKDKWEKASFESITRGDEDERIIPKKIDAYVDRLGAKLGNGNGVSPQTGHAFFNGRYLEFGDTQEFLKNVQTEVGPQLKYLQELVYQGVVSDGDKPDMANWFYDQPGVSKRRNKYILPGATGAGDTELKVVSLSETFEKTGYEWKRMKSGFLYPPGEQATPLSTFVIADLDSEEGLAFVKEALGSMDEESNMRLAFIHNPSPDMNGKQERHQRSSEVFARLAMAGKMSESVVTPQRLGRALGLDVVMSDASMTREERVQSPLESTRDDAAFESFFASSDKVQEKVYREYVKTSRLVARHLGFAPGTSGLVVNGRVIGPIEQGGFISADFKALGEYEYKKRTEPAIDTVESTCPWSLELDRAGYADVVSLTSSVLAALETPDPSEVGVFDTPPRPRRRTYLALQRNLTMFTHGDSSSAMYHVVFVLNPLSETAQKWSGLIEWLTALPDTYIEVHLNPSKQSEIPLKRFYRYNTQSSLVFDETGNEVPAHIVFEDLPVDPLYTLAMDVPSPWLVRPRQALYDLDNIQLTSISPSDTSVDAVFELDYLVIEGHAWETISNAPPRGLQLQLVDSRNSPIADTQVVANLGYLQFRAKPGVFKLEIRDGRGREIYDVDSVGNDGWDSLSVDAEGAEVTLTSFDGLTLFPRFSRKKGMENVDVLENEESEEKTGIIDEVTSRFKSLFQGAKKEESQHKAELTETKGQADINIFTVASGLLYERFVGIMILSVLHNTNSTVKFWFIENFLSPSFLEFIPHMAKEYGFQYELITYKWPSWLRAQREKQRIIWAYKILFLDVLFPMDLKKVIFVDADQIVRADLKELVDLDLHRAPYAYTPMGDDNYDMEGFRFWKQGYWKDMLQGKPYHISALYVVDLVRFRQLAAGDILRGQYQQLSADPHSLANLDQDLPNNLQRLVPIHSLHEDWLWCETWCNKDRLQRAKTIDLCQNPLTKEPKLARARQIPEWEEYDAEIARFTRKLAKEGKIRSGIAAADTNVLASVGNAPVVSSSVEAADMELNAGSDESRYPRDEL
ncbi:hypothetical protein AX17_004646 [Amanita inopinata Kibby_2008]|nr:hypothetical protein AX17_004646 [Amanita inopinata Kibby_2008]